MGIYKKLIKNAFSQNINCSIKIEQGNILIYSDCQAYLIIYDNFLYHATQIFNNGNEELGFISYSGSTINELIEKLYKDYGRPIKILNINDLKLKI